MKNNVSDNTINADVLKKLAARKIYFGHQSVGYNIIDGLTALLPADSGLNIIESSDPDSFSKPVFAHSQNGENFKPETKIAAFISKMDSGLGNKVDMAFFKFCYVDVTAGTDVNKLFTEYKTAMDQLIKKYPKTKFLHFTVPVTMEDHTIMRRIKDFIKGIIGRTVENQHADNIKRMEYNTLLKKEYGESVFDLADAESTDTDGNVVLSDRGGIPHHILLSNHTTDGGHLTNESGKVIAGKLIMYMLSIN